jgi:hypothetical protein
VGTAARQSGLVHHDDHGSQRRPERRSPQPAGHLRTTITDAFAEQGTTPSEEDVTEAAFWIAHALHVWVVEAEAGERDHRETLNRLGELTPPDQPDAAGNVFVQLADIAQARGPRAWGITVATLRAELERRQVLLQPTGATKATWVSCLSYG